MKRHAFPLALTATLATVALAGCGNDEPTQAHDPASTPAQSSTPTADASSSAPSTAPASEPPSSSDTGGATDTTPVPVFFVGDTPQGPRLYAEQRDVEADNPASEAVALIEAGDALDPDYSSLVPADSIASATLDDGFYAIELTDSQWTSRPAGMSAAEARLAIQQLVYTLEAQAGPGQSGSEQGVDFYLDGQHVTYLGVDGTVNAAREIAVRALVNVTSPTEGATVSGSFTATGEASSFEATVPWEIRDQSGSVVQHGFATAEGWQDHLYPWQSDVDVSGLEPGTYTFAAMTDDPSDGEGPGPTEDTKTIVVQ